MRLIDADELENVVTRLNENGRGITRNEYKLIESVIFEFPTIEPKVGKWIRIGYDIYECSECHQYVKTIDIDAYDWCHHCGAKMERSE